MKPYYYAYEDRYRKVYEAGGLYWGHTPEDEALNAALGEFVKSHALAGKSVIEFACGEGGGGVILSRLGCNYHGVDVSPAAVEFASKRLGAFPNAKISLLDMTKEAPGSTYDAAVDIMGFHMLVLDTDREAYLKNAYQALKPGAHMLFYRQLHDENAIAERIESFDKWLELSKSDYTTLDNRTAPGANGPIEVAIPLVPGRSKSEAGYRKELEAAGFEIVNFTALETSSQVINSASILVIKR